MGRGRTIGKRGCTFFESLLLVGFTLSGRWVDGLFTVFGHGLAGEVDALECKGLIHDNDSSK